MDNKLNYTLACCFKCNTSCTSTKTQHGCDGSSYNIIKSVEIIEQKLFNIEYEDEKKNNFLHMACMRPQGIHGLILLLSNYENECKKLIINKNNEGLIPFQIAYKHYDIDMMGILIEFMDRIENIIDHEIIEFWYVFMNALTYMKRTLNVLSLVNKYINNQDKDGNTALMFAGNCKYFKLCNMILDKKEILVDAINKEKSTILNILVLHNELGRNDESIKIMIRVLEHKNCSINNTDKKNFSVLQKAVLYNLHDIVELLLNKGATIDFKSEHNFITLSKAFEYKMASVVGLILLNYDQCSFDLSETIAILKLLIKIKEWDFIAKIISKYNVDDDDDDFGKIMLSVTDKTIDVVENIIQSKEFNPPGMSGIWVFTCMEGGSKLYNIILDKYKDTITSINDEGNTALILAIKWCKGTSIVKRILSSPDCKLNHKNDKGQTALSFACAVKKDEICNVLLDRKDIIVSTRNNEGKHALHYVLLNGMMDIANKIASHVDCFVDKEDMLKTYSEFMNRKHWDYAASILFKNILCTKEVILNELKKIILAKNYDALNGLLDSKNYDESKLNKVELFALTCEIKNSKACIIIMNKYYDLHMLTDDDGNTTLIIAIKNNAIPLSLELIPKSDINAKNKQQESAMYFAIKNRLIELCNKILDVDDYKVTGKELLFAQKNELTSIVTRMIDKKNCPINYKNEDGKTLLILLCCSKKYESLIIKLLTYNPNTNIIYNWGNDALYYAKKTWNCYVIKPNVITLLESYKNIELQPLLADS
jgi:ankyrin repeat protein